MSDVREFLGSMDEVLDTMSQGTGVASAFREELQRTSLEMTRAKNETAAARSIDRKLTQSFSTGIKGAVDELVINGSKLSDALRGIANSVIQTAYSASVKPVTDHIGGAVGGLFSNLLTGFTPFAKGGVFSQGSVTPFASGGVVNGPVAFPMRGGTGLMGEAGPEAIMPLTRGADGKLGVRAQGGRGSAVNITMNISTPDVAGFRRSETQIAAQMSRALQRGNRNL